MTASMRAARTIRYRCPAIDGMPLPGEIVMGDGPRTRRAYRILGAKKVSGPPALGVSQWRLTIEAMSAAAGVAEIEAGARHWSIAWDARRHTRRS